MNGNGRNNGRSQMELDKRLVFSLSKSRMPSLKQFKYIKKYLSRKELWLMRASFFIILVSLIFCGVRFYLTHLHVVPAAGGQYTEALIGFPKYINPLYAGVRDVDNDISQLVYSSLFQRGKNGELIKDLVEDYFVDESNKIYTFTIRGDARWHDSELLPRNLSADDIIFTFNIIQDEQYKSPLRPSFIGVMIEKVDDRKFKFILSDPYAAFLELLTFGVMPAEIWSHIPVESFNLAELNLKPVGSGPYKFSSLTKNASGKIVEYILAANKDYYNSPPMIDIGYKFFSSFAEEVAALNENQVDGLNYLPSEFKNELIAPKTMNFHKLYLPQLTAIFFNQDKNSSLADKKVRQALAMAINKEKIIKDILDGEARAVDGPILSSSFAYYEEIEKYPYDPEEAASLLDQAGWKFKEVIEAEDGEDNASGTTSEEAGGNKDSKATSTVTMETDQWRRKNDEFFTIRLITVERKENEQILGAVKIFWEEIGVKTEIEILPASQMQTAVIKPRDFEALFYGQVVGADPDPYAFWHSSQAGENGFNIANFTHKEVDQLIEDARLTSNLDERREKYIKFQEILAEEMPAIFMYSPVYTYVQHNKINNFDVSNILHPSDRFANVAEWYIETENRLVW